eukprot:2366618-Prymnesium_polylepis.1
MSERSTVASATRLRAAIVTTASRSSGLTVWKIPPVAPPVAPPSKRRRRLTRQLLCTHCCPR